MTPSRARHSRWVLGLWLVCTALVIAVACVPIFRAPWSETVKARAVRPGLFVSEPLANIDTPFVSFAQIRLSQNAADSPDRTVRLILVDDESALAAGNVLSGRAIFSADATSTSLASQTNYDVRLRKAIQFDPVPAFRVVVTSGVQPGAPLPAEQDIAEVTLGYDGRTPAVSIIHYWWPWLVTLIGVVTTLLVSPQGRRFQQRVEQRIAGLRAYRGLLVVLSIAVAMRFALAAGGGQYFDMDELRYGRGVTRIFDLLSTGYIASGFKVLLDSPDHPGFRIAGLPPALFQTISAWRTGHAISDIQHLSGEWLAAFVLSLSSVGSIGLTYLLAHRLGATKRESLIAAVLMLCSCSMLIYSRHFFPYDASMAGLLLALWIGLHESDSVGRSFAVGAIAGMAFLTYEGYWLTVIVVGLLHASRRPFLVRFAFRRAAAFGIGVMVAPVALVAAGMFAGQSFLEQMVGFSNTITHGEFSEGWSLPWKYLWQTEHGLLAVMAVGIVAAAYYSARRSAESATRGLAWLLAALAIYAGLVISSNVLHRFVVYDRLARQMLPFMCLAAAAGLTVLIGNWLTGARAVLACGLLGLMTSINLWPVLTQEFPREFANDAVRRYGLDQVRLGTTVLRSIEESAVAFLPPELNQPAKDGLTKRYILLNTRDIWIMGGPPAEIIPPPGAVLAASPHPRQLPSLQYHGYTPRERKMLRSIDFSMKLIDTASSDR